MTHLKSYLDRTSTSQQAMATTIGVSRAYMSELVGGTKTPSLVVAVAIERATGGSVPPSAWVPDGGAAS